MPLAEAPFRGTSLAASEARLKPLPKWYDLGVRGLCTTEERAPDETARSASRERKR